MRVGRAALDEDAIRLIEESNPGIEFDWPRILKGPEITPPRPQTPPERRARPRIREVAARDLPPAPIRESPDRAAVTPVAEVFALEPVVEEAAQRVLEQAGPSDEPGPPMAVPAVAASARLGVEGLSRLRARHAEVLARITEKIDDPARREELKSEAARLNPDTWVTDADVAAGLEGYETVFEALRGVIGHRRQRRRRPAGGRTAAGEALPAADAPSEPSDPPEEQ